MSRNPNQGPKIPQVWHLDVPLNFIGPCLSNRPNHNPRPERSWALEKFGSRAKFLLLNLISDHMFVGLSWTCWGLPIPSANSTLVTDGVVIHLYCTRSIVKKHLTPCVLHSAAGIQGFTRAFSLSSLKSSGITHYKSGACVWLTFELVGREGAWYLV